VLCLIEPVILESFLNEDGYNFLERKGLLVNNVDTLGPLNAQTDSIHTKLFTGYFTLYFRLSYFSYLIFAFTFRNNAIGLYIAYFSIV